MSQYRVYDVFTDKPFGGNQLAVFPDASGLAEDALPKIAREFNFSETTFVYPPSDPANTARVRIFTPGSELQFAGHPTIGTATALRDLGHGDRLVLELGIGPVPCRFDKDIASFTTSRRLDCLNTPDIALIGRAVGIDPGAIATATHAPQEIGLGTPFHVVELVSRDTLATCQPDIAAIREGAAQSSDPTRFAVYVYHRDGDEIAARMFAPLGGISEDPATGSAAAALVAYLRKLSSRDQNLTIRQGVEMGRPSIIHAKADAHGVEISGQAVLTMEGRFVI